MRCVGECRPAYALLTTSAGLDGGLSSRTAALRSNAYREGSKWWTPTVALISRRLAPKRDACGKTSIYRPVRFGREAYH